MKSQIYLTVILTALPLLSIQKATNIADVAGPGLVNRPQYPYPNGQSNYKVSDVIPGYSSYNVWNVTDDLQYGTSCIENYNCTSKYCNEVTGLCQPPCKVYQGDGNSSNGCYCEANTECASGFCSNRECKTPQNEAQFNGLYCSQDVDCSYGQSQNYYFEGKLVKSNTYNTMKPIEGNNYIGDKSSLTNFDQDFYDKEKSYPGSVCDYNNHVCVPRCKMGGCFCTRDNNCDSYICYKNKCKAISYVPGWTLAVGIFIIVCVITIIVIYRIKFTKYYLVPNIRAAYGAVLDSSVKPPDYSFKPDVNQQIVPQK